MCKTVVGLLVAVPLVASAQPVVATESRAAAALETEQVQVPWAAYEVGVGERSVLVGYANSGCGGGGPIAPTVAEGRETVTITLRREVTVRPPGQRTLCKAPHLEFLSVELHRPLAGRELAGALDESPTGNLVCVGECGANDRVPGLVGFSLKSARTALKLAGFGAVVRHRCSKSHRRRGVVSQTPEGQRRIAKRTRVRLCVANG